MNIEPGTRLGPYEILATAGAGGMGEVYRARDTRLDRTVAIKLLPAHLAGNEAARQRLDREARAVSSLSHPNICPLYDVGHEDGKDFLVMEFLEGETLAERLSSGPLPFEEALRHAIAVAEALDTAHGQGVIHRDLKPGNIMVTKAGTKLLDFGLAKAAVPTTDAGGLASSPTMTTPLTVDGSIVGTFQYMAPEQLEGKPADARSDIFAFGAVLHEMMTGRRAFEGQTQAGLIASILKEEPEPVSSLQGKAPPALDRLVRNCMAKDPDQRRQTMRDVLLELRWIAEGGHNAEVDGTAAGGSRSAARLAWATAAMFALVAAVLAFLLLRDSPAPQQVVRAFVPPPPGTNYAVSGPRPGPVSVSPDGSKMAFVVEDEEGGRVLWVRKLDALTGQPLSGTEGAIYPFWSHDGETIAFFASRKLRKIPAAGGPALTLCDADNGKGGSWGPDGTILFAPTHQAPIHRVSAAGGEPVAVTVLSEELQDNSHRFPQFLPDGEHFLYFARSGSGQQTGGDSTVRIGSLGGGEDQVLFKNRTRAVHASGHLLFSRERALMAQPFDASALRTTGDAFPVANEVLELSGAAYAVFSASPNGTLVYQASGAESRSELVWLDNTGKSLGSVDEPDHYDDLRLSPDSKFVAMEIFDPDQGASDLWVFDLEREVRTRFTFDAGDETNPIWSPDGSRILFASDREGVEDLYVNQVGGTEPERPLLKSDVDKTPSDWSRDGRYVIFGSNGDIWALPLEEGSEPFAILQTDAPEFNGRLSPDGRWMLYTSAESGQPQTFVTSFPKPGRKWQLSRDRGYGFKWGLDGREVFYGVPGSGEIRAVAIERVGDSLRIGADRGLFTNKMISNGDITDDGTRIFAVLPVGRGDTVPLTLVVNWTAELK